MKTHISRNKQGRDSDSLCDNFDLALSPEVVNWFNEKNGTVQNPKRAFKSSELDEYELSLI